MPPTQQQTEARAPLGDASSRSNQGKAAAASKTSDPKSKGAAAKKSAAAVATAGSAAPAASSAAGKKRKAESSLDEDIKNYTQDLDDQYDPDGDWGPVDESCQKIRGRLTRLFDSGVITKKAWCDAVDTNSVTLGRFMNTKGTMNGVGSSVYYKAWLWFKQREMAGLKMPDAKKRKQAIADEQAGASSTATDAPKGKASAKSQALPDISHIELEGEAQDDVPTYDSCDEIRKKINAHMKLPGVTAAQFCRDLYAQYQNPPVKAIQSGSLTNFRGGKGAITGAKSTVYYTAYVYFEKLRIAQGKPKSEHRKAMESMWDWGMPRDVDSNTRFLGHVSSKLSYDQYGKFHSY
ncbi:hypothetical protein MN608_05089 [Microdochium nivale]|nr:hypothetical protein MN608_05089 [Microdochium nivale]